MPERNDRCVSVLYVHHAGTFGGASRSLLELIQGFAAGSVVPRLVTQRGNVAQIFARSNVNVIEAVGISQFDHTRFGHYRGRRWLLLLREALYLPFTVLALLRARRRWKGIDIVHVNEVVLLAAAILGKTLFRCPLVVHVRSVQETHHGRLRTRIIGRLLQRYADAVIAIDETVRRSLPPGVAAEVIHNSHTPRAGKPEMPSGLELALRQPGVLRVAMVGSPLSFKGVREFVEAAHLCRQRGLSAEFLIAGMRGSGRPGPAKCLLRALGFAHDAGEEIEQLVKQRELADCVRLLKFTPEIDQIYANVDVLCFPSHLDAVGRPVIEAAFWKVPSIVAVQDPQPDTMIHGETGLCIEPGDPGVIADAVSYFSSNRSEIARMGEAAHRLATRNFDARKNAERMLAIYRRLLEPSSSA